MTTCQGGCGKVRSIIHLDDPSDWLCYDCKRRSSESVKSFRFFFENAGYVVGKRALGALRLMRAEQWAKENGYTWEWSHDIDPDLSFLPCNCENEKDPRRCERHSREYEVLGCVLYNENREHRQSLWGIVDPDWSYRRLVQAELALEEMPDLAELANRYIELAAR